jgi:hypothetical protein
LDIGITGVPAAPLLHLPRRSRRDQRDFVLPPVVEAPRLLLARAVAQRLERDGRLDRPAPLEPAGLDFPHGIPVAVPLTLVRDLAILSSTNRIGGEQHSIAPVVEGTEDEADEIVALPDVAESRRISFTTMREASVSKRRNET